MSKSLRSKTLAGLFWSSFERGGEQGIRNVFSPKDNPSKIIYRPEKPSQNSYLYDISKAVNDFGYKPEYDYIEMLQDMKREMSGHRFDHLADVDITI
ncbi:MAG: NAD(P)-dependent oxidoreductase [Desulfobacteraceae bacterium]|nr:NAD(P)-dependent oxidoreductase [Desulfobacteraceae bacterium]